MQPGNISSFEAYDFSVSPHRNRESLVEFGRRRWSAELRYKGGGTPLPTRYFFMDRNGIASTSTPLMKIKNNNKRTIDSGTNAYLKREAALPVVVSFSHLDFKLSTIGNLKYYTQSHIMTLSYQINVIDLSHSHLSPTLLSNLSVKEIPIPIPGPTSVVVRIRAAALNFRDLLCLADSPLYPVRTPPGLIPCNDGAGEIVSAGLESIWKDSIGKAVILLPSRDWINGDVGAVDMHNILGSGVVNGTLSQYVVVEDPWLIRAPKNLSFEESAALPGAAGTAMNVLESISIGGNTTVVTQGTGGVSCAVIQVSIPIIQQLQNTNSNKVRCCSWR